MNPAASSASLALSPSASRRGDNVPADETPPAAVLTLVLWLGCVTVGALGLMLAYPRPRPPVRALPPIQAQMLEVEIASIPLAPPEIVPPSAAPSRPAPAPAPTTIPDAAPLLPVAAPSPALAFPLPVEGPTRAVAPAEAAYVRPPAPTAHSPTALPAQPLTFGQGDGRQPAPEYPRAAVRADQEGTVRIGFTVGEDGRVLAAEVVAASPWPLLNEAARRTVRERWRFAPGTLRRYEVPIRFELQKKP